MKKKLFLLGMLGMALAFGLVLAGCGGGGSTGAKALVGTWEEVDLGLTWTFTGNKFTQEMMGVKTTVPYKIKGNAISTEYQGAEVEMEFEISGDTLTVDVMGFLEFEFERANKSGAQSGGKNFTAQKPEHFKYDLTEDGAGVVIQSLLVPEGTGSIAVKIPAKIEGYPVTEVESLGDDYSERLSEWIKSFTSPDSVTVGKRPWIVPSVKSITFPDSVTVLGENLLWGSGITKIDLPPKITVIPSGLFFECKSITSVKIPNGVTEIGDTAFYGCSTLKKIVIPDSVTKIRDAAFNGCSTLKEIVIPGGVSEIGTSAFIGCSALKEIVIPDSVSKIEMNAFSGCIELTSVKLPSHPIEYIMDSDGVSDAFKDCPKLSLAARKAIKDSGYQGEF